MNRYHTIKIAVALLLMLPGFLTTAGNKIQVPLRFDFYYSYEEMNQALEALNKAYPKLTSSNRLAGVKRAATSMR
jgi:hypothetical protein